MPGAMPPAGAGPPAPGLPTPFESRPGPAGPPSLNLQSTVKNKNAANISSEWTIVKHGGLLTRIEKPILPPTRITSDKVVNPKPVSKSQKPVESKNNKETNSMSDQETKLDKALEQLTQYLAATKTAAEPTWNDSEEHEADLEAVGGEMTGDAEKHTQQEALIQNPGSDMVAPDTQTFPNKNQENPVSSEVGSAGQGPIGVAASKKDEHEEEESEAEEKAEHADGKEKKEKKELPAFMKNKKKDKEAAYGDIDPMDPMEDDMSGDIGSFADMDHETHEEVMHQEGDDIVALIRRELGDEAADFIEGLDGEQLLDLAEEKISEEETGEPSMGEPEMGMEMEEGFGMDEDMPGREARRKKSAEFFNAEDTALHVDVAAPLREEVGPDTQTFGSDPMHVGQPVTTDGNGNQVGGPMGQAMSRGNMKAHIFSALKIAETEVSLGMIPEEEKFDRAADLEDESPEQLHVREETLASVKKAGLNKPVSKKVAGRVPSLKTAGILHSYVEPNSTEIEDSALFS
jgi:hypothetical protein